MQRTHGIEYEASGKGDALLFMHGAIIADCFAPMIKQPSLDRYRLISYRRRGFGRSEPPTAPHTIESQAADARSLLEHLGVAQAHVVAYSGGGPIAIQFAFDSPDVVRSLVLVEPALQNAEMAAAFDEFIARPLIEMHQAGQSTKAVHLWMRSIAGSDWRAALEPWIPGAGNRADEDAAGTFEYDLAASRQWDFEVVGASRITQPVLYIVGARSAARHQPITEMFRAAVPDAALVTIPEADHSMPMTKPALVAQSVAEFVGRHPIGDSG